MDGIAWRPLDPESGRVVRTPPAAGRGSWAGFPGAYYDAVADRFYLCYAYGRAAGEAGELLIAESSNGIEFRDCWRIAAATVPTPGFGRPCLRRLPGGRFGLFMSFVDPEDGRWRIDLLEAESPRALDARRRRALFPPGAPGPEALRDPWIIASGPAWWLFSAGPDGEGRVRTDRAVSGNGREWRWLGPALSPGEPGAWDGGAVRISALARGEEGFVAFYDGAAAPEGLEEARTGLAFGFDLRDWTRLTAAAPCLVSPHGSGCLRYLDVLEARGRRYFYYEYARADGAHELRAAIGRSAPGR